MLQMLYANAHSSPNAFAGSSSFSNLSCITFVDVFFVEHTCEDSSSLMEKPSVILR